MNNVKRNFLLNTAEGALYLSANPLVSPQTVLPAFVVGLGGSNLEVGIISVIAYVCIYLPQVFVARYAETMPWKKPPTILFGVIQRAVILMLGLVVFLSGLMSSRTLLLIFFILFAINQTAISISSPIWFDFFAKVTPPDRRGRLMGIRTSIGGIGATMTGLLLTWILATFAFPSSYGIVFLIAAVFQFSSIIVQTQIVEEKPSETTPRQPMFDFLRQLPVVLRQNRPFRDFLMVSSVLVLATMPAGFLAVYALNHFTADEAAIGHFTIGFVAAQVVGALVVGMVADRYGHKRALMIAAGSMACANVVAFAAPSLSWLSLAFPFAGINFGTEVMSRYNLALEYGMRKQVSVYIGLMNTLLAPLYFAGVLGGWMSDMFGYHALFAVGVVCSAVGFLLLVFVVRDPRLRQLPPGSIAIQP